VSLILGRLCITLDSARGRDSVRRYTTSASVNVSRLSATSDWERRTSWGGVSSSGMTIAWMRLTWNAETPWSVEGAASRPVDDGRPHHPRSILPGWSWVSAGNNTQRQLAICCQLLSTQSTKKPSDWMHSVYLPCMEFVGRVHVKCGCYYISTTCVGM